MGSRGATDGRERQRPSIGRNTGSHSVDRSVRIFTEERRR